MELVIKGIYRHFKGKYYIVEDVAFDSETMEEVVVYRQLYGEHNLFIRKKEMFLSKVDKEKYPSVIQEYRFELIKEEK
jgi:hypothetical protein